MKHKCNQEKVLDLILKKLDSLESKVDNLISFKLKLIGMIAGISLAATWLAKLFL